MVLMRARRRGIGFSFLSLCALLFASPGCAREKCTSSAECQTGEICAGPGTGPFHCLAPCATNADCGTGTTCTAVTSADCPECDVVTLACVDETPHLPGR